MNKICNLCKLEKPLTSFYKDSKIKSGYRGRCKDCVSKSDKKRTSNHQKEDNRVCSICKIEKPISGYYKSKRSKNGYFAYCKLCHNDKKNLYVKNNKQKVLKQQREYKTVNRDKINTYTKKRYLTDITFRISSCLRSQFRHVLKRNSKTCSIFDLLDCDIEFFKSWIEYQFEDWMLWDNYGEWQFDHVTPCSSFDFSDKKAQMRCFNWRNIQPLEKFKNNSKNNKILDDLILKHSLKVEEYMSLNLNPSKEDEGSETR